MWVVGEVAQFGRGDYKSGEPQEDRLVPANQRLGDKQRADEHEWGNIIIRDKVKGFSQRFTGPTGVCRHPVRDRLFEGEKLIASDGESEDRSQQQRQRTCKIVGNLGRPRRNSRSLGLESCGEVECMCDLMRQRVLGEFPEIRELANRLYDHE